ncbi:hypothetical protein QW131_30725 [Roseibium salinum]|nr:hypothetical protein [Roseibium salinum]
MRAFIVFLAVTAAVVLVIAVARPRVSTQHVEARVAEYVAHASGGKSRITGESALRLLPLPVVTVKSVEIEGIGEARQAARIDIPSMEVSFQFLPLLMSGELVVDGIKLDQPVVQLVRTPGADRGDIKSGLNSILQAVLAADSAAKKAKVIDVQDGRIELEDGNGGRREEIAMPRMHLARADRQDALHLAGKVEWHGFQIGIDADLDTRDGTRPGLCCEGDVTVEIAPAETEPGSFEVPVLWDSGTQTDPDAPRDEPYSLSELLTQATAAAPLRLSGAFKAGTQHVRLEDVALELGDIAAAGSLGVDLAGEVPSISAEMAFQELDLGRHLHAFLPTSLDEVLAWPVRADVFANADLDLSAVVAEAALGDIIFAGPSVRLVGNRRGITLTLERTEVASGRIQGLVTVQPAGQEALVQLSGSLADVSLADIGEALRHGAGRIPVGQDRPPEGYVTGSIDLSGKGSTLKAVTRSLRGWGRQRRARRQPGRGGYRGDAGTGGRQFHTRRRRQTAHPGGRANLFLRPRRLRGGGGRRGAGSSYPFQGREFQDRLLRRRRPGPGRNRSGRKRVAVCRQLRAGLGDADRAPLRDRRYDARTDVRPPAYPGSAARRRHPPLQPIPTPKARALPQIEMRLSMTISDQIDRPHGLAGGIRVSLASLAPLFVFRRVFLFLHPVPVSGPRR